MAETTTILSMEHKRPVVYSNIWLPLLILIISLVSTYWLWGNAKQEAKARLQATFDSQALEATSVIAQRMKAYGLVLQGVRGLFTSSETVDRGEFQSYINSLQLPENLPGMQGVFFVRYLPAAQRAKYVAALRKKGIRNYTIFPSGNRAFYCPVSYAEPSTPLNQKSLGMDTCADEKKSLAKNIARDTGMLSLTGKTKLSVEDLSQPGIVMVLPVYANGLSHVSLADRRANIHGWVTATFRMNTLMAAIVGERTRNLDIEVYDGTDVSAQAVLYDSDNDSGLSRKAALQFSSTKQIAVGNRTWTVAIYTLPNFSEQLDTARTALIGAGGTAFSLLITLITWMLLQGRKRAETLAEKMSKTALRNEDLLNEAQQISHVGSWELNLLTGQLLWSDQVFDLFELDKNRFSATYEGFLDAVHPDDRDLVRLAYERSLQTKEPYKLHHRLQMQDGRIKWVAERGVSYFDADGKAYRSVGTIQDITERKLAESLSKRHQVVIDTTHEGFWVIDLSGNLLEANQAYADMSGYSVTELETMHVSQLEAIENAPDVQVHIAKILKQGYDLFETRHRHRDGHEIVIEVAANYLPEAQQIFAFFRDITERKKAEESIRIAAAAFETHEGIMITDGDANILQVNRAFEKITGYTAEEVVGKNPRVLSSGRHDKFFYKQMWEEILSTGTWSGEIWDRRKSGNIYPKQVTITAVVGEQGKTTQYVSIFTDISERKKAEEEIHNLAFYDALTGLPNRRALLDRINIALSVSSRSQQFGALLFLDLDNFKTLNDTQGHEVGDEMLVEVANRLRLCVREVDTIARLGGDEFLVLIENISADADDASQSMAHLAEKIRSVLAAPYLLKRSTCHGSPSIGVCLFHGNMDSVDELIKHADIAMYQAKEHGRNRVRFFDPQLQQSVETRASLEADLRKAIIEQQLHLYYQIQVDQDQKPIGAEALIRWIHPARGLVSPADFIPIAEASTIILDIGQWVLDTACKQIHAWSKAEQTRSLTLAVNISAQQFNQPDFVDQVTAVIQKHNIKPSLLKLELTESVALGDIEPVMEKMRELRNTFGVALSLDDFGTGYSSLTYLKRLPLDQIKIDQSFVRDMTRDSSDKVMIKTIIDMARNFHLDVIAEGVETDAQLAFLRQFGCKAYQGYLFSKPVPIDQFEALLNERSQASLAE